MPTLRRTQQKGEIMIVTNKQIQEGELDKMILAQIKTVCNEWTHRYSIRAGNDTPFHLGIKLKDIYMYQ